MNDDKLIFDLSGTTSKEHPELDYISPEFANAMIEVNNYYTARNIRKELEKKAGHLWWLGFGMGLVVGLTVGVAVL